MAYMVVDFPSKGLFTAPYNDEGQSSPRPCLGDVKAQEENGRSSLEDKQLCFQKAGFKPFQESDALLDSLRACGKQNNVHKGSRLHAHILKRGLLSEDVYVGTALLHMYANCGAVAKAQEVFDELPLPDVATWNALIAGYAQNGLGEEALNCFEHMQYQGFSPNVVTFVCILKACSSIGAADKGEKLVAKVLKYGLLLHNNIVLSTALVNMYISCGLLTKAQQVFDELHKKDLVSWNALISGYAQQGLHSKAMECFRRLQDEGLTPNAITFICILKACGNIGAIEDGVEIHAEASRRGLLEKHVYLGNALIEMYVQCGALLKAQEVCDAVPTRDVASWNSLMGGYAQHGFENEALICFKQMQYEGLSPNAVSYVFVLQACGSIGGLEKGEEIHAEVSRQGLLETNIVLGTAVVDMYVKCGSLSRAFQVFHVLPARDIALWNTLLVGLISQELHDESLKCFQEIQNEGLSPNMITYLCVLKACSCMGAINKGEAIEAEVRGKGLLEEHVVLGTALVDLYAKCGILTKAQEMFDGLLVQDIISWTALMAGYAQLGEVQRLLDLFSELIEKCIDPSTITFVVLLSACSHAGLVEEGQQYFKKMSTVYSIVPTHEHLICMVDLFSRAGQFDKALNVIAMVPESDQLQLWSTLLGACQKWKNVELARFALQHAEELDKYFASGYICMRNIYSCADMQGGTMGGAPCFMNLEY